VSPLVPVFLLHLLSFVNLGSYWNNHHHHLMQAAERLNGSILWANLALLFWLSLFPFATGWMGENHLDAVPTAFYGIVSLLAAIAYFVLQTVVVAEHGGRDSALAGALGRDLKGKLSPVLYALGIGFAFISSWAAVGCYVTVALMWLIPDRRLVLITH
jgi:uncharacterized membrane protein